MEKSETIEKIIIFGTGRLGMQAFDIFRADVVAFIDNDSKKQGREIEGRMVYSLEQFIDAGIEGKIIIACKASNDIKKQLNSCGIDNYSEYVSDSLACYVSDELVYNPYENEDRDKSEIEWSNDIENNYKIREIDRLIDECSESPRLEHVEIETVNRCNGSCSFCPVSKKNDTREYHKMSDELFKKIISDLEKINYSGRLALFSNNEPLLDENIIDRHLYARQQLPNARMHLFTNGTLLSIDIFVKLMQCLDELVIDNYQQDLKLIKPCQEIVEYCKDKPDLKRKVTIVLRKPDEILTSRGGDAPNRDIEKIKLKAKCILPFKQMIIRPDGKVSLCCNDPLGKNTLADLNNESIIEAWNNPRFQMVRKCLSVCRTEWKHCEHCDTLNMG